jgi:outer membrane receptor protein involved in Fe transport
MKPSRCSLSAILIATTALIAPQTSFAQETGGAEQEAQSPADAPQEDAGSETAVQETIVVRGAFIPEPLRETSEVAAFLSAEDLSRQGDANAADALTRVTGLSIAEGRFIYVRGLGERYSSALLNGSPLPSPEPLQRVVPLDLFPSSILENVLVQKSYSVEFPGEFGGGVIELSTLNLPARSFLEL